MNIHHAVNGITEMVTYDWLQVSLVSISMYTFAICGRPAAKQQKALPRFSATLPQMGRLWPAYLMRHGLFLAHLVFANEKAWFSICSMQIHFPEVIQINDASGSDSIYRSIYM